MIAGGEDSGNSNNIPQRKVSLDIYPNFCGWICISFGKSDNFYVDNTESDIIMDVWLAHVCIFLFLFPPLCSWLIMRKNPIRQMRLYGVLFIVLESLVVLGTLLGWVPGCIMCICILTMYNCCAKCLVKLKIFNSDDAEERRAEKVSAADVPSSFGGQV